MGFPQRYDAAQAERRWQETWARARIYEFAPDDARPIFAIDTPPPTVSGEIHIGHVYSYVQAEAMARFWRMQGYNVYYPFGFDDNGLPTERFVERRRGIRARDLSRPEFIAACLEVSRETEDRFEVFWKGLGMSIDWRFRYSTIDPSARRTSQWCGADHNLLHTHLRHHPGSRIEDRGSRIDLADCNNTTRAAAGLCRRLRPPRG